MAAYSVEDASAVAAGLISVVAAAAVRGSGGAPEAHTVFTPKLPLVSKPLYPRPSSASAATAVAAVTAATAVGTVTSKTIG